MSVAGCDKHQLAGLDDRIRGFSRPVEFERAGESYRALLRYETVRVATELFPTQDAALLGMIQVLQSRGYRQLKTQKSFSNGLYLGSQELWVEYPDPPEAEPERTGFLARMLSWFRPGSRMDSNP
ncbi:MAG: hypothetical protein HP491_13670 [Nitrospira sp.]|nr:hypothetical protein [Nitrospira sp.]MBH0184916.1 hypothetical protein [Nitrospira sp.]